MSYLRGVLAAALCLCINAQAADAYPRRSIALVVPFSAGGPTDVLGRTLAAAMSATLGQSVVVENRTGAGGTIGANLVAKAAPNGYTFLLHHTGMATAPALYRSLPYDPLKDFEYVSQVVDVPMTLVGRKDLEPQDGARLLAYLKTRKEKVNLAHSGPGAVSHLCAMLLQQALGTQMTTVPYQGTAPALTALVGGHVDLLCDQTTQTIPHIKEQRIKLYAAATRKRLAALPDTPTLGELGLKDFEVVVWHGVYAPKGTPKEIIEKVGAAVRAALKTAPVKARLTDLGAQFLAEDQLSSAALASRLRAEIQKWTPIIQRAGAYTQ